MNAEDIFNYLSKLQERHRDLVLKICDNILQNPQNPQYQTLNVTKLRNKVQSAGCFIDLLTKIGFSQSQNGKGLIFDARRMNDLQRIKNLLTAYDPSELNILYKGTLHHNALRQLMDDGLNEVEAMDAIKLSFESNPDTESHLDASTISQLINMGYTQDEANNAIKLSMNNNEKLPNMDMDEAVKYLIQLGFTMDESLNAFVDANYDINIAIKNLNNNGNYNDNDEKEAIEWSAVKPTPLQNNVTIMEQMGFSTEQSIDALKHCKGNVQMAVDAIVQCNCYSIKQCKHLLRLISTMKQYDNTEGIGDDNTDSVIVNLLNDFNHLLHQHQSDDDFEVIYQHFGALCDIKSCCRMKRHSQDRELHSSENKQESLLMDVTDKIHCHFVHCYDLGLRLTHTEKDALKHENGSKYVDNKRNMYQTFANFKSLNKFHNKLVSPNSGEYTAYSFGQRFYYWKYFKECDVEDICNFGYRYKQWYIQPKYLSLKEELLCNNVVQLTDPQWKKEFEKVCKYERTDRCKALSAQLRGHMHPHQNMHNYDIKYGAPITRNHLISISVYCGYTHLSQKFSETFRRLDLEANADNKPSCMLQKNDYSTLRYVDTNKESDESFKQRNSNFYYMSKYIIEAVQIFSKLSKDDDMITFYHGISDEMIFDSMKGFMYQPLSTSRSWAVAVNFSSHDGNNNNNCGMIVAMNCHPCSRYFDCEWISDFPYERELLFIACSEPMLFVNITTVSNDDFRDWIKAISIIECCTGEHLLQSDNFEVYRRMVNEERNKGVDKLDSYDLGKFGATKIKPNIKLLVTQLIKYRLNMINIDIPPFIERLLHNICDKKSIVCINYRWMSIEMSKEYMFAHNGYLGYLFLKNLLFDEWSMIKLNLLNKLHPNLRMIQIGQIPTWSTEWLDKVLQYLSHNTTQRVRMISMDLERETIIADYSLPSYKTKFWSIGWDLRYSTLHAQRSFQIFNMSFFTNDRAFMWNPQFL